MTWLHTMKERNAKLTRWVLMLQEFSFDLEHCKGTQNQLPDALSRSPSDAERHDELDDDPRQSPPQEPRRQTPTAPVLMQVPTLASRVLQAQDDSPFIQRMIDQWRHIDHLQPDQRSDEDVIYTDCFTVHDDHIYEVDDGRLRMIVPDDVVKMVIEEYHNSPLAGHPGRDETLRAIRHHFFWVGMKRDVSEHVKKCLTCSRHKKFIPRRKEIQRPRQVDRPWDTVAIDIMGAYPETTRKKRFILTVTDLFSKWLEAFPLSSTDVGTLITSLEREVFSRWGFPRVLLTDNGPQFLSRKWTSKCEKWRLEHHVTPTYHPRGNPAERRNQELKVGLRLHLLDQEQHNTWDQHIPKVLFSLRRRRNEATKKSPSDVLLGAQLARPGDWDLPQPQQPVSLEEDRRQRLQNVRMAQRDYNRRRYPPQGPAIYSIGQHVLTKAHPTSAARTQTSKGLAPRWQGPFTITSCEGGGT